MGLNAARFSLQRQPSSMRPSDSPFVPDAFVDSDSALTIAERAGGAAFRDESRYTFLAVEGGYLGSSQRHENKPLWAVRYDSDRSELTALIDMATGEVIETDLIEPPTAIDAQAIARARAGRLVEDSTALQLFRIYVADLASDGRSPTWNFSYLHPTAGRVEALIDGYNRRVWTDSTYQHPSTAPLVPEAYLDSDAALALAEATEAVQTLRTHFTVRAVVMEGGYAELLAANQPPFNSRSVWFFQYIGADTDAEPPVLNVILNMATGEVLDVQGSNINVAAEHEPALPPRVELYPNYPNPFNPQTTIPFALPKATHITLTVYDLLGRTVATLADDDRPAGTHTVVWHADAFASGLYFVRLTTDTATRIHTLVLQK